MRVEMGIRCDSPRVARTRAGWRFRGVVHEILMHADRPPPAHRVPDVADPPPPGRGLGGALPPPLGARRRPALARAVERDPADTRTAFYLAETYLWLERHDEAEQAFRRRIALGGWAEEIYESKMAPRPRRRRRRAAPFARSRSATSTPTPSPRTAPSRCTRSRFTTTGSPSTRSPSSSRGAATSSRCPVRDTLFVDEEVYTWKLADLVAASAYWLGEFSRRRGGRAQGRAATAPATSGSSATSSIYLERKRRTGPALATRA